MHLHQKHIRGAGNAPALHKAIPRDIKVRLKFRYIANLVYWKEKIIFRCRFQSFRWPIKYLLYLQRLNKFVNIFRSKFKSHLRQTTI